MPAFRYQFDNDLLRATGDIPFIDRPSVTFESSAGSAAHQESIGLTLENAIFNPTIPKGSAYTTTERGERVTEVSIVNDPRDGIREEEEESVEVGDVSRVPIANPSDEYADDSPIENTYNEPVNEAVTESGYTVDEPVYVENEVIFAPPESTPAEQTPVEGNFELFPEPAPYVAPAPPEEADQYEGSEYAYNPSTGEVANPTEGEIVYGTPEEFDPYEY